MLTRARNAYERVKASLSATRKTASRIAPLIFSRKSAPYIGLGTAIPAVNAGLNLLIPKLYSAMVEYVQTWQPVDVLGTQLSGTELVILYGATSALSNALGNAQQIVMAPLGPIAAEKMLSRYVESQIYQSYINDINTPPGIHNGMIGKCFMSSMPLTTGLFTSVIPPGINMLVAIATISKLYGNDLGLGIAAILAAYTLYSVKTEGIVTRTRKDALKYGFKAYEDMVSVLNNYLNIHLFGKERYELDRVNASIHKSAVADTKANAWIPVIGLGQVALAGIGLISLIYVVYQGATEKRFSQSDFIFLTTLFGQFTTPLSTLGTNLNLFFAAVIEAMAALDKMEEENVIKEYSRDTLKVDLKTARIEFDKVSFEYEEKIEDDEEEDDEDEEKKSAQPKTKKTLVLDNLSFVIEPGQKIGFVGVSGAGKSTIAKLLFRFYDPTSGRILINGQDIKQVSLKSLRQHISMVPQETVLQNDTFYQNVLYGAAEEQKRTRDDVLKAIDDAHLTETVAKLRKQLQTRLGERGAKLSGGQKQRVAIARTILKAPEIMVFDEATSALDAEAEEEVQANIERVLEGRTAILIAHRLTTLRNVDQINVLKDGKIVECGPHDVLTEIPDGIYATLWRKQQKMKPIKVENKEHVIDIRTSSTPSTSASQLGLFANSEKEKKATQQDGCSVNIVRFHLSKSDSSTFT